MLSAQNKIRRAEHLTHRNPIHKRKPVKLKPYKLQERAVEVNRLNMLNDTFPESHKVGQPSDKFIQEREKQLKENLA